MVLRGPTAGQPMFPGHTYQDGLAQHHGSENAYEYSALPRRRATLLQIAAEIPAAVLAELLDLTPGTATR